MKIITDIYESPCIADYNIELEGYVCVSQFNAGEDELVSMFGDEGGSGKLDFEWTEE